MAAKIIAKDNAFRTAVRLFSLHKDVFLLKFVCLFDFSPFFVQKLLKKIFQFFLRIQNKLFIFIPIFMSQFFNRYDTPIDFQSFIIMKYRKKIHEAIQLSHAAAKHQGALILNYL